MRKKGAFAAIAALMALGAWGQSGNVGLALRLLTPRVLPGEPLFIQIGFHNGTSAPVSLSTGDGAPGSKRQLMLRKPDGTVAVVQWPSADMPMHPLAPGESAVFQDDLGGSELLLLTSPGKYELWAEYESAGRVYWQGEVYGRPRRYTDYWKGSLKSNTCSFEVIEPQGEDRQAYDGWLKPYATGEKSLMGKYQGRETVLVDGRQECRPVNLLNEILRQYPTSTYAAYVVYDIMRGFGEGDQAVFMNSVETGIYLSNSYPGDTGKNMDGWKWLKGKEAADWWSKWIGIILKNHPGIWFADELRLKLAVDQVALKNYQGGAADLEVLSKQAKPDVAQKAQSILDAMKQKGWIKDK